MITIDFNVADKSPVWQVAILWRVERFELKYEWVEPGWGVGQGGASGRASCASSLDARLSTLLTTDTVMPYRTVPPELFNENTLVCVEVIQPCYSLYIL